MQSKSKLYEYKYKIDTLKKRLFDKENEIKQIKIKYKDSLVYSDECVKKQEKYKLICKEYKH